MSTTNESPTNESPEVSDKRKDVNLPNLPEQLESRVERILTEYEERYEPAIWNGEDGIIPRIQTRDYLIEACIGIILTLYFVIALFVV